MQFDRVQHMMLSERKLRHEIPGIVYPQLLGLAMGLSEESLGLKMNIYTISKLESYRQMETEN